MAVSGTDLGDVTGADLGDVTGAEAATGAATGADHVTTGATVYHEDHHVVVGTVVHHVVGVQGTTTLEERKGQGIYNIIC